jgi:hypothetical protein
VLVEAERLRPGLEQLLAQADYVVTSAHFPQVEGVDGACGGALSTSQVPLRCAPDTFLIP